MLRLFGMKVVIVDPFPIHEIKLFIVNRNTQLTSKKGRSQTTTICRLRKIVANIEPKMPERYICLHKIFYRTMLENDLDVFQEQLINHNVTEEDKQILLQIGLRAKSGCIVMLL